MQGWKRRIVYVLIFEICAIAVSAFVLSAMSGAQADQSAVLAVMISVTAMAMNLSYNAIFESIERRWLTPGRTVARRVVHALGFQVALVSLLIPMIAWWFSVSLWQAFLYEAVLMVYFPLFTFAYTWVFDSMFGEPASATA